jgi:hypothetical protein
MAFGLKASVMGGGDFADIVKYDANAGRLFRVDYDAATRERESVDITTPPPRFAIDFGSLEIGYVHFSPIGPPDFRLTPMESPPPVQPDDKDDKGRMKYQPAFRVKLWGRVLNGLREWSSSASSVMDVVEHLYHDFRAAPEAAEGKIPVVELSRTVPVTFGGGERKRVVYAPSFTIVGWTERTSEMGRRTVPIPRKPAPPSAPPMPSAPLAAALATREGRDLDDEIPF